MKLKNKYVFFVFLTVLLTSCGAYLHQPLTNQEARLGEHTGKTSELKNIPTPVQPIVVGVYNFKDQTGQYKEQELGSTFSTAITQGATTILVKALEDSKWFKPIERENLGNLMQERNIIRTTRNEFSKLNGTSPQPLKPLLFAGILLEGGVVSYDTNILTGGAGARYFGAGGAAKYRQDRITVYLRAVSTSTGEILKTVYVSKTILSQAIDVSLFRYVSFKRLLEVETGFTKNEPTQLAIQESIEKAVESLIIEGMINGLWSTNDKAKASIAIENYNKEKELDDNTGLYNRQYFKEELKNSITTNIGIGLIDGDYAKRTAGFSIKLGYRYDFSSFFSIHPALTAVRLNSGDDLTKQVFGGDLNFEFKFLPHDKFSPFVYAGPGAIMIAKNLKSIGEIKKSVKLKTQFGFGFQYYINHKMAAVIKGDYNLTTTDELDYEEQGTRNDNYFTAGIGLNFHF